MLHNSEADRFGGNVNAMSSQAINRCMERATAIVEAETQALQRGGGVDFKVLNERKAHILFELAFALKFGVWEDQEATASARRLADALERNRELLETRLRATEEIAAVLIASLRFDASDGTYTIDRRASQKP